MTSGESEVPAGPGGDKAVSFTCKTHLHLYNHTFNKIACIMSQEVRVTLRFL